MPKSTSSGRPVADLDQDVVGLHVPVHQAVLVRVLERLEDRLDDPASARSTDKGPSARSTPATVRPSQIGHGVEHQALPLAHEVDRHGVGMVEAGDGAGLLLEAGDRRRRSRAGRSGGPSPPAGAGDPCPRTSYTSAKPPAADQPDHAVTAGRARGRGGRASRVSLAGRGSSRRRSAPKSARLPGPHRGQWGCPRRSRAWQDEQTSSVRAPPETNHPRAV